MESVFSIRLVIADFYMEKPVMDLDPVYSEFRGKEIKKVPIIRVFGSNAQGQKTCMHVHGVFPYFYVPYDQKDFESANQAIYQIAINLDKAINISLSQGGSSSQHVFKVQLVKGIPFYGYHRSEHQYLKIYMFNPRFVRRAANLLQNGAIMNKNFHPHEAHVPYILQFMIDYNLYGMSCIHVPSEIVKFRRCNASEVIPIKNLKESQILDFNIVKKLSCSRLECDIGSNFILNRFQLIAKSSSTHTNPGIESIWHDEKLRRQKMVQSLKDDEEKSKAIPRLEVPSTQERPNVYPTESETFYRTALLSKLLAMETSMMENSQVSDQTINSTLSSTIANLTTNASLNASLATTKQQKRIFNLSKILQNAVYPEECSQNDNLVNASFVENHLSNNNAFQQSLSMDLPEIAGSELRKLSENESIFLDDTIVDEELVLSLTQSQHAHVPHNATLRQEDMELLDILQQLEEDNDNKIDLDSSLAPLTQDNKNFALSPERLDKETTASVLRLPASDTDSDEEHDNDDKIHDFSVALENLDDLILKLTQSGTEQSLFSPLPQTDGSDDLPKTPTKVAATTSTTKTPPRTPTTPKQRRLTLGSPIRSPRTPKSGHKYKPLPLIITNRSTGKKVYTNPGDDIKTPCKTAVVEKSNNLPLVSLRKKLAMTELRRKSISAELHTEDNQNDVPVNSERTTASKRRSKRFVDLDKTHVTCNLTPRRTNEKLLKIYNVDAKDLKKNASRACTADKINDKEINTNQSTEKDICKYLKNSEGNSKNSGKLKDDDVNENDITSPSRPTESKDSSLNFVSNADEGDEEIVDSDNETSVHLGKTPNLKRLRRSFHSTHSAKRRKIECNDDNVINSSKFENAHALSTSSKSSKFQNGISKTDQSPQPEGKTTSTETNLEIVEKKNSIRLSKLSKNLCKGHLLQSVETSKESTQKREKVFRRSGRLVGNNHSHDVSKANNTKQMENSCNIPEPQPQLVSAIKLPSTGESSKNVKQPTKNNQLQTRKCRIRLKNIAKEDSRTRHDLDVVELVGESEEGVNTTPETKPIESSQKINDLQITEKSKECEAKTTISLVTIEIPEVSTESGESIKTSNETNVKTVEKSRKSLQDWKVCVNTATEPKNSDEGGIKPLTSLDHTDSSSSLLHSSNTDNLLKSLLKLTSSESKEWRLTASPSLSDSTDLPLAQTNYYPSQSSSLELISQSPLPRSSDEEIAETPPAGDQPKSIVSLYETSKTFQHSPLLFTQNSSPSIIPPNEHLRCTRLECKDNNSSEACIAISSSNETAPDDKLTAPSIESTVILTPLDLPPTRDEVLTGCLKLKLPEYEFQQPFYSNPDDVTKQKEIGFTILQINSNKLNDLEEFQSILGSDVKGLAAWRRNQLSCLGGPAMLTKYRNTQRIREYFASQKTVAIVPQMSAPSRQEVKVWLKARQLLRTKGELKDEGEKIQRLAEEDSPIKVRRQKITLMLNNEGGEGDGDDSDNCLDSSIRSLSMTPLTPSTPAAKNPLKEEINKSFTPVTTKIERIPLERLSLQRRRHNRRVLRRVSLNQKIREALERDKSSESSQGSLPRFPKSTDVLDKDKSSQNSQMNPIEEKLDVLPSSVEAVVPHSQTSETSVSSQTALAEMERSSFMQQIEQADVTMGCSNNNSSLNNTFGFKVALENLQQAKADIELNYLTIITLEVFVATRDDLYPNPQVDEIRCLFYAIENSIPSDHLDSDKKLPRSACGYIMVHDSRDTVAKEGRIHGIDRDIEVTIVQTEVEALEALLGLCSRWDADIYAGYEIEMSSWGFVMDRAKYLCLNIAPLLSRVPSQKVRDFVDEDRDQFTDLDVETKLCGRILLDVWRLMRSEIALTSYTFENVMYHIKHKRCPWHSYRTLTEWFASSCSRWIVIEYFLERVRGTLGLLDQLDLIGRTSEMAKLIGIQFYEVLSRGSQFRVESMMLRIAKPKNLVPLSPSVQQRAHMRAPEYLALILEPQSRFYADPVIVLDFQSLYPSMIIGYNYCFSTCLGRVEHLGQSAPFEFGASQLRVSPTMLRKLLDRDLITISPCGVVFVKSSVREGILPRMLTEILDTRQMVKQSMKIHKSNSALQRILHSRQLGLKLMANVTYGYTAANFSGRMPAVEVGDTVVSKGRETLERAIKLVEANEKWNVKVVYGDTDSMFVQVPGRNREEAFRIGEEIAEAVTKQNPHPVKLKLEKVYQPCILQTKKRYVGYMYETADQKEPVYEAKGIETVRRDGCPMVAKMLEKVLRILFESADVSQVKQYVCRQFTKLLSGRANLQDLIFAKEFRGMNGYKPNACVPALELTRKWIQSDPRHIPRRGERVPFIITNGPPGVPLIRLIRHPHEVLADEGLKINAVYYITKAIIPPLNRCLLLLGADVNEWFANLPRKVLMTPALSIANEVIACPQNKSKKSTISQFFSTTNCIVDCGRQTKQGICDVCNANATRSMIILQTKISKIERAYLSTQHICQACCGRVGDLTCGSLDCPVLYVMEVKRRDLQQIVHFRNLLEERF